MTPANRFKRLFPDFFKKDGKNCIYSEKLPAFFF